MSTTRRGTVLIVAGMVAALSAPIAVPDGTGHGMMAASVEVDGTAAGAAPLRPETYEVADEPVTATLQVLEPVELSGSRSMKSGFAASPLRDPSSRSTSMQEATAGRTRRSPWPRTRFRKAAGPSRSLPRS